MAGVALEQARRKLVKGADVHEMLVGMSGAVQLETSVLPKRTKPPIVATAVGKMNFFGLRSVGSTKEIGLQVTDCEVPTPGGGTRTKAFDIWPLPQPEQLVQVDVYPKRTVVNWGRETGRGSIIGYSLTTDAF